MSKTGRYMVIDGEVVKVSDEVPRLPKEVYLPRRGKFYDVFCDKEHPHGQWVDSKVKKRALMKEHCLEEVSNV